VQIVRQKRKGATTQRRKVSSPWSIGRPPTPFWGVVRPAHGSESELPSPFADLSSAGVAHSRRTNPRMSHLPGPRKTSNESPAARRACLGGGTGGLESLFSGPFAHATERGRSPRLPCSNTVQFGQDLCAFASLRLCVNSCSRATKNQGIWRSTLFFFGCGQGAALGLCAFAFNPLSVDRSP